ncbi:hypothetical protein CAEBREN_29079 [Caenorhabditis brenneri]|uniref:C6 domain-containing protein n=1 Tax=Caenorhabditis brenneri TaxID=135651 RepID=G0P545_CAEBE|nr:hypothetical protein CAEBREN_29079 [Caenorhabditis brenneri]
MQYFLTLTFLLSAEFVIVESCIATSPTTGAVSTAAPVTDEPVTDEPVTDEPVTDEPVTEDPLRRCAPTAINFGTGDDKTPQVDIDVTYSNYVSTQVGDTLETTNTMQISCTATGGLFANMIFDNGIVPVEAEVIPRPTTVTVNAGCSSVDMVWNYVVTFNGQLLEIPFTGVECQQTPF